MSEFWNESWKDYDERKRCPMCDSIDLKEEDDLSKPIFYFGFGQKPMYVKINVCKKCGYKWYNK